MATVAENGDSPKTATVAEFGDCRQKRRLSATVTENGDCRRIVAEFLSPPNSATIVANVEQLALSYSTVKLFSKNSNLCDDGT